MDNDRPLVSIGIPVLNGEKYLAQTLDSILAQTFSNFEIVISDNGSSDSTNEICREYQRVDSRIRYFQNRKNRGASWNYNEVFRLSQGKYFKWAAHDDLCAPAFLDRCVEVLEGDETVLLCYPRTKAIDEAGEVIRKYPAKINAGSMKAYVRFFEFVCVPHPCVAVFGLIRSNTLRQTRLIGNYASSDRTLLGELSLRGRFYEVPEYLFFYRVHSEQSWHAYRTRHDVEAWYDPMRERKFTFPHWRMLIEHLTSIYRVPLPIKERAISSIYMVWWIRRNWRKLLMNLVLREA
jgi:glycosyltransferase involved in cell wall biosynthesis